MGKIDPAILEEFDLLAGAIGITPKFNSDNEIVPIGARNPQGKVYVVWVGRGIGLFSNWGLTAAMVKGFHGAIYKSFHTLEAARQACHSKPSESKRRGTKHAEPEADTGSAIPQVHPPPVVHLRLPADVAQESSDSEDGEPASIRAPLLATSVAPLLTSGTISGGTVTTPTTPKKMRPVKVDMTPVGVWGASPARAGTAAPKRAQAATSGPSEASGRESPELPYDRVRVRKGEYVFVVIRGDKLGIYFDRMTALLAAGSRPGMKIIPFKSLSRASWYFVQQYMKSHVGVPIVDISDEE
ncbi:hypothetical protein ONZ51_g11434 [Trametes cubensis]|uniref:Ribonuclease H1 N-terminal domain-containing protein n=1 Tax=Trametes cubensis TaxID=1111947 RepID=A0AAD7TK58_9APHY|nr:hypothetical protein ONZ51_g11434 [Trametes cubensis]